MHGMTKGAMTEHLLLRAVSAPSCTMSPSVGLMALAGGRVSPARHGHEAVACHP